jgi:hypothetical protein
MIRASYLAWCLTLVPACFHPNYDHPACGPNSECPIGLTCNAQLYCDHDGLTVDASLFDVPPYDPVVECYGAPGSWQVCLESLSLDRISLPLSLNTDGSTLCLQVQPVGWAASQPASCIIVGDTVTVPTPGTRVQGRRPLVLVARSLIMIVGVLDVASHRGDRDTLSSECQPFSRDPEDPDIAGGGGPVVAS